MSGPQSVGELVRARAEAHPDAVALAGLDGAGLTFGALAEQLARTEAELRDAGIGRGDRVALVLENGPELACAFLGVASAASCAPLNPAYRERELEFYLSDLRAAAVVVGAGTGSAARATAERLDIAVFELEPARAGGAFRLAPEAPRRSSPSDEPTETALLLHTSGTTARPKLVPLTHENLRVSAAGVAVSLALTPADRCLAVMPLFHIHGLVASVLAPLSAGSAVVAASAFDAVRILDWLGASRATWYTGVPTMHMSILERARRDPASARALGLRLVRSSSAALPTRVLAELEDVFGCPAIEAYGMTEAAHQIAANPLPPGERKPGSVGLAAGPEIAVLDEEGRTLEPGELGEVAIRGASVFAGYEANPEANDAAFSDGWFRTGDEGLLDEDGYLFLRGRLKELVNRGGEKVSPREVEDVLLAHPGVAEAVVFAQPHVRLGEEVAAAVVLRDAVEADASDLRRHAAERLAPFKVPRTIVFPDRLPTGATGKVQRIGLAERLGLPLLEGEDALEVEHVEPRTPLERRLCGLFQELLDVPRVGIHDSFFALGGDSLHVVQLLERIDAERGDGTETLACVLLRAPTVAELAALLERDGDGAERVVSVGPHRAGAPFFFFPTHEWATVGLGALAERLESEHTVHTFQPDLPELAAGSPTIPALAPAFAEDIRSLQPRGPYYLGGHCFGAALALEVARVLQDEGDEVAALVLLNPAGEHPSRGRTGLRWILLHARRGTLHRWVFRRLRRSRMAQTTTAQEQDAAVARTLGRAAEDYRPRPYPGRVSVFAGADYLTPPQFWRRLVDELDWRRVPGYTDALFRTPFVDALAVELGDVLRDGTADRARRP